MKKRTISVKPALSFLAALLLSPPDVWSSSLLLDVDMAGTSETAKWNYNESTSQFPFGSATPPAGVGTSSASPMSAKEGVGSIYSVGAFRSTSSYYSFMSGFGVVATTSIQDSANFTDIKNVVFQRVSMVNPGSDEIPLTIADNLNWNGIDPEDPDNAYTNAPLIVRGGPLLDYYSWDGASYVLEGTLSYSNSFYVDYGPADLGAFSGDMGDFVYQWDLSGIAAEIVQVVVRAPILVHSATTEAQLDISNTFALVPEPGRALLLFLGACCWIGRRRRLPRLA